MNRYETKSEKLLELIEKYTSEDVMIAFSGGVDSSLLLKLACESAKRRKVQVYAVTIHTKLHPHKELEIAQKGAAEAGAIHIIIHADEWENAGIKNNPEDRCYRCKKYLFSLLKKLAAEKNVRNILEGTNEDDLHVYRPGIKALKELGIESPLAASGMTKKEIRQMAGEYGISVAERPSSPCLATRFPYGTELTDGKMRMAEKGEEYLRALGFRNIRLRIHENLARIEVDRENMSKLLENREKVILYFKCLGFVYITLDMEGFRSGSMDHGAGKEKEAH